MEVLNNDVIFEIMKNLGRTNFTFRATCHRMWDLFAKYRHLLEQKQIEIIYQKDPINWTIKIHNLLFDDYVFYAWNANDYKSTWNINYHPYSGQEITNGKFRMGIYTKKINDMFYCKSKKNNKFYCISFGNTFYAHNGQSCVAKINDNGDAGIKFSKVNLTKIINQGSVNSILQNFINNSPIEKYLGPVVEAEIKKLPVPEI